MNEELRGAMAKAYTEVRHVVEESGVSYREAAFEIGGRTGAHVAKLRGLI